MKIVITNVFGPLNLGDFELFKKLVERIDLTKNEVSAIARDSELCEKHFSKIDFFEQLGKAKSRYSRLFYLFLSLLFVFNKRIPKCFLPKSQFDALLKLEASDMVLACPGGFLEDSSLSFYTHLIQLYVASKLTKACILSPMSIGPVRSRIKRFLLKKTLSNVDKVYVRELVSSGLCRELAINHEISNDLAFEFNTKCDVNRKCKNIAYFTIINWNFPLSKDKEYQLDNYINSLVETAIFIREKYGFNISVIQQVASDKPAIDRFLNELSKVGISTTTVGEGLTPDEIMLLISEANIVIASRFHSAIFSLNVGTPVVAISYLPKTTGMLDLYEVPELYLYITDLRACLLKEKCSSLLDDPVYYPNLRRRLINNFVLHDKFCL